MKRIWPILPILILLALVAYLWREVADLRSQLTSATKDWPILSKQNRIEIARALYGKEDMADLVTGYGQVMDMFRALPATLPIPKPANTESISSAITALDAKATEIKRITDYCYDTLTMNEHVLRQFAANCKFHTIGDFKIFTIPNIRTWDIRAAGGVYVLQGWPDEWHKAEALRQSGNEGRSKSPGPGTQPEPRERLRKGE
ncbi:MAG: hypothetical protein JNM10_12840 [Planctomycetia bacterium]|nr:hypothetical protein [Planctomycetia bacterium]